MRLTIVQPRVSAISETFLSQQAARLPVEVSVVYGFGPLQIDGEQSVPKCACDRIESVFYKTFRLSRPPLERRLSRTFQRVFQTTRPDVVLAQYGPTGVRVLGACQKLSLPLVTHFHGFDAYLRGVLGQHASGYAKLFQAASSLVSVSRPMTDQLLSLGAPAEKIFCNPYGVDCQFFTATRPGSNPPVFLAVGRFVEKKGPQLTLRAFAKVLSHLPESRLRMIGDGPLLPKCKELARDMEIEQSVSFLGPQGHEVVRRELRAARAFVQHSIKASDGDSEGTPVAILEAGATGLPVVATRHTGINDAVLDGVTGFLVEEEDYNAMAERMLRLGRSESLANSLGSAARKRIEHRYSVDESINRLHALLVKASDCT